MNKKSTPEELREQFDKDVERFTNVEKGQSSTMDAQLGMELIERGSVALNPTAQRMCDIGCGGGNFALRVLRNFPGLAVTLLDLSPNMLKCAAQRVRDAGGVVTQCIEGDIRTAELPESSFDIMTAAAVLHHLRSREEWKAVLEKIYQSLKPGGTFWMWDLVQYKEPALQQIQMERFASYLVEQGGEERKQEIFERIQRSDTPETSAFICQQMCKTGFQSVDILHKNAVFCALYGKK